MSSARVRQWATDPGVSGPGLSVLESTWVGWITTKPRGA